MEKISRKNFLRNAVFSTASASFLFGTNQFITHPLQPVTIAKNSGKGFNYQGVARDADGAPKASEEIYLRFTLIPSEGTAATWIETTETVTSPFGVFSVTIGKGDKAGGIAETFKDVDFSTGDFWMKVEIQLEGIWTEVSMSQFQSVPYAEVANFAKNAVACPVGSIMPFAGSKENVPEGWVLCDGRQLDRSEYSILYTIIGNAWGHGNGSSTFHIPDLRGLFLRGVSHNSKRDEDRSNRIPIKPGGNTNNKVGSLQLEDFHQHKHGGKTKKAGDHSHRLLGNDDTVLQWGDGSGWSRKFIDAGGHKAGAVLKTNQSGAHEHSFTTDNTGGNETRPDNAYVNYIIKY